MNELAKHEWKSADMRRHLTTFKNFEGASVAAAKAMADVQERKLYLEHYTSLKDFCELELGWTKQRLYQILQFHKIREKLPMKGQPWLTHERQARALSDVPKKDRLKVLKVAGKDGKITAKAIAAAAKKLDEPIDVDQTGYPIPSQAKEIWNRGGEVNEYLDAISKAREFARKMQGTDDLLYAEVNFNSVYADLTNAFNTLKLAIPYAVCSVCQGRVPKTCAFCKGRGVISKFRWRQQVPSELKEIRAKVSVK